MIWTLAGLFGVTAAVLVAASSVALRRWRRPAPPDIAILCMGAEGRRRVRLQLRVLRAAGRPDWTVSGIEWLAPDGVRLTRSPLGRASGPALTADLRPDARTGLWFMGDATIWAVYPSDWRPAHRVSLRLTLERGGRSQRRIVSAVFPAFDWSPAALPAPRRPATQAAALVQRQGRRETGLVAEPRSFAESGAAPLAGGFA